MIVKIHISEFYKRILEVNDKQEAKTIAWREMGSDWAFHYGWLSWEDFNSNVRVEEIES